MTRYDDATEALFRDIGEFVFQFSQLEFTIRAALAGALGLSGEQFDAVTSAYDFRVLCQVSSTVLKEGEPAAQRKRIEAVFKRCIELNNDRVRIAHGTWTDAGARHVARQTFEAKFYFKRVGDVKNLAGTAEKLIRDIMHMFAREDEA